MQIRRHVIKMAKNNPLYGRKVENELYLFGIEAIWNLTSGVYMSNVNNMSKLLSDWCGDSFLLANVFD